MPLTPHQQRLAGCFIFYCSPCRKDCSKCRLSVGSFKIISYICSVLRIGGNVRTPAERKAPTHRQMIASRGFPHVALFVYHNA